MATLEYVSLKAGVIFLTVATFSIYAQSKECTNIPTQPAGRVHAMLALLGHYDNATRDYLVQSRGLHPARVLHMSGSESKTLRRALREGRMEARGQFEERTAYRSSSQNFLCEFSVHKVRLHPDSPQGIAEDTNLQYLLMLNVDRLLWSFRETAGLPHPGMPYEGWERPISELRGHFVGHYLSASAYAWASTRNESLKAQMQAVVAELAKCQDRIGTGYLSAFPTELFDRFEAVQPVWAPYYTIHKIMTGLLDQYMIAGSNEALEMVLKMTDYFKARVDSVIKTYTIARHWETLNEEYGGMNDLLYRLYTVTGDVEHLRLAHLFDKPCFLGPLALQVDDLSGLHSNTHIPLIVGAQMRYEILGDQTYKEIAHTFMNLINTTHGFATGGTSSHEFWHDPNRMGSTLDQEDQESCTTYNMLKISRNLFRWGRETAHLDYYERTLVNGILGIQRGRAPGVMIYMLPLGPGNSKAMGYHGWGTPFASFWCCYGTGIESFAKLGDSIYFHQPGLSPSLYVAQFVSSTLQWEEAGLQVTQTASSPLATDPFINVDLTFSSLPEAYSSESEIGAPVAVYVRIPWWTHYSSSPRLASLNGESIPASGPGTFLRVERHWRGGDHLRVRLPVGLRTERIQDDRKAYTSLHAILFGPYLLAGLTNMAHSLAPGLDPASPSDWLTPVSPAANRHLLSFRITTEATGVIGNTWHQSPLPRGMADSNGMVLRYCDEVAVCNGEVTVTERPEEGTQAAAESTFRIVIPLSSASKDGPSVGPSPKMSEKWESTDALEPRQSLGSERARACGSSCGKEERRQSKEEARRIFSRDANDEGEEETPETNSGELDLSDMRTLIGRTVSFEVFSRPGLYLAHNGADQPLTVVDSRKFPSSPFEPYSSDSESLGGVPDLSSYQASYMSTDPSRHPPKYPSSLLPTTKTSSSRKTRLPLEASRPTSGVGPNQVVFRVVPGLAGGQTISLGVPTLSHHFVSVTHKKEGRLGSHSLHVLEAPPDESTLASSAFAAMSSFSVGHGLAAYHNISFIAKGADRDFLLQPISAMRDEHYTAYFDMS